MFKVDPPKSMELTGDEVRIVKSFQNEFKRIGNLKLFTLYYEEMSKLNFSNEP